MANKRAGRRSLVQNPISGVSIHYVVRMEYPPLSQKSDFACNGEVALIHLFRGMVQHLRGGVRLTNGVRFAGARKARVCYILESGRVLEARVAEQTCLDVTARGFLCDESVILCDVVSAVVVAFLQSTLRDFKED